MINIFTGQFRKLFFKGIRFGESDVPGKNVGGDILKYFTNPYFKF